MLSNALLIFHYEISLIIGKYKLFLKEMLKEIYSFEKEDNLFNKRSKGVNFMLGDERMNKQKDFT